MPARGHIAPLMALALSFLAGLAAALGFQPLGVWPLTVVAFASLLWLIERAPNWRGALARGWAFGLGHFVLGLNWIATAFTFQSAMPVWLGWVAVVLLSIYLAVYPAVAALLAWAGGRGDRLRLVLWFAAAWIVTEWLRATLFTGFAWNPEGVALIDTRLAALAPWIGTYGLSAVVMLFAGALLLLIDSRRWARSLVIIVPLALGSFAGPLLLASPEPARGIPVRIVQPNIGQQDKWKDGFEEVNFARLTRLSAPTAEAGRLLLWPEAAVTEPLENARRDPFEQAELIRLRARVGSLIRPQDLLLTGGVTFRSTDGRQLTSATNSVFAIRSGGRIVGRYDKAHLVPYGEYLPARPILSAIGLSRLAPGGVDFDSGPGPQTIDLPLVGKVGFQLCYEIIFSGEVIDRTNRPAILFNPSNDAWFGRFGPPQHLAQARLRAIEEGVPVLRSTPTGISAIVDAHGEVTHALPWREAGVIDAMLPTPTPPTLFARYGNLLPFLFAILLAVAAVAVRRKAG